jgi:mannose-6-phosphate isomerase-like protein (cupin superfamily)
MKIYKKQIKSDGRGGFWGDFGEIDMGWSYGEISSKNPFPGEKLHYHKVGTIYFLALEGIGLLEVEGERVELEKDSLLRIDPGEKYKVIGAKDTPFKFIAVCTSKDPKEKIVVE